MRPSGRAGDVSAPPRGRRRAERHPAYGTARTREESLARIRIGPARCFGKPCVRGHRTWVSLILDPLASGMTTAEVLEEYPPLEAADVLARVADGSEVACERYVDIPLEVGA